MASKKFERGSIEWQMFTDYWSLCQKYWETEDNNNYWEMVVAETNAFYKKYKTRFAKKLVLALAEELTEKWKDKRRLIKREE